MQELLFLFIIVSLTVPGQYSNGVIGGCVIWTHISGSTSLVATGAGELAELDNELVGDVGAVAACA